MSNYGALESDVNPALTARLLGRACTVTADLIAVARRHGVHLLIADSLSADEKRRFPELARELLLAAATDAAREAQIRRTLDALAAGAVEVLVLKGAALAYLLYPASHLRPRVDTDLLIERGDLERADRVLASLDWCRVVEPASQLSAAQRHYQMPGAIDTMLHLDLHWRLANPHVFATAPAFPALRSRAIALSALGSSARTISIPDAMLLACLHRLAHHDDAVHLLWLWDIHLLIETMTAAEREQFVELAGDALMTAVCRRGVALAAEWFGSSRAAAIDEALRLRGRAAEPSASFVGGLAPVGVLRTDLASLGSWRARAALLAEHLFPSAAYVRSIYPRVPAMLLPLAYAIRIVRGIPKWIRSPR
jgi:hypothetical protein